MADKPNPNSGGRRKIPPARSQPSVAGFDILGRLGEGAMGTVWEAIQLSTRRRVALKLLSEASLGSAKRRARFVREVELAASLEHPNIARIYDSGLNENVYFYAMELVHGLPLDEFIKQKQLSVEQILRLMKQVCAGMEYAHARGVVHRDLKPSNILVDAHGEPHILDFGLAKAIDDEDGLALSMDGDVTGTPMYMSPEQAAGEVDQIDARTDVYSLGVIAYRLLTGTGPHDLSGSYMQVIRRIADQEVRRPRKMMPTLDREVEAILLKALAHKPAGRYESAGRFAEDIDNYLENRPLRARRATPIYLLTKKLSRHRRAVDMTMLCGVAVAAIAIGLLPGGWLRGLLGETRVVNIDQSPIMKEITRELPTTGPTNAQHASYKPTTHPINIKRGQTITNSIGMKLVAILPGTFVMGGSSSGNPPADQDGSEQEQQREVTLTDAFYCQTTTVTVGQFKAFVNATSYRTDAEKEGFSLVSSHSGSRQLSKVTGASWKNPGYKQDDLDPVVLVSWNDDKAFCDWLSEKEKRSYRLPTEAEWEYACRAGTKTAFFFGDEPGAARNYAWYEFNSNNRPQHVGQMKPNPWGLYDMVGNVWQLCEDRAEASQGPATDSQGSIAHLTRVLRGGAWCNRVQFLRSDGRFLIAQLPSERRDFWGFRVVLDPD